MRNGSCGIKTEKNRSSGQLDRRTCPIQLELCESNQLRFFLVKYSGEGIGNPLQYSCLENPMGGGDWQATVHGFAKSWTQLSDFTSLLLTSLVLRT